MKRIMHPDRATSSSKRARIRQPAHALLSREHPRQVLDPAAPEAQDDFRGGCALLTHTKWPVGGLVTLGLFLSGVVAATSASDSIADGKVVRWVEKTVSERQPSPEDKRFDEIGWVTDIRTAIKLGKEHNRPIVLYTGDGRINTGRC